jgi:hypothetical protein
MLRNGALGRTRKQKCRSQDSNYYDKIRAVAQAVSRWLPTAAARVRVRAACGVCGGQSSTGAGFLRVLRFPLPIIPPISPSSYSPGAGTIGLLLTAMPSGSNWTPPPLNQFKKNASDFHSGGARFESRPVHPLS